MQMLPINTSAEEVSRGASVAVLPVGSFEQHGAHLPMSTDAIIASLIAERLADDYDLFRLPPITISCSHEHEGILTGSVSISARTLYSVVTDVAKSLERAGIDKLVIVNGHGGNYVLSNVVQEANVSGRRMMLYPTRGAWHAARTDARCATSHEEDMHGGELETSLLLHAFPDVVRDSWRSADFEVPTRPDLLTVGMAGYTSTGIIGRPSAASAEKGEVVLDSLSRSFDSHLEILRV
jgi:creatinine amidohydrolase